MAKIKQYFTCIIIKKTYKDYEFWIYFIYLELSRGHCCNNSNYSNYNSKTVRSHSVNYLAAAATTHYRYQPTTHTATGIRGALLQPPLSKK